MVTPLSIPTRYWSVLAATAALLAAIALPSRAQNQDPAPASQSSPNPTTNPATPDTPAQIELLETKIRFESNGDSRKEVHTRVRINSELGVRQFSRLNFNFNRAYEQIDIPLVHISHKSGGSADILPSAITDQPNAAVADYPAYQDVRVKSIRILGLEPADILEYRVITTTTHHPLAPAFWLDHSFDRTGVVTKELFTLDLPATENSDPQKFDSAPPRPLGELAPEPSRAYIKINPATPPASTNKTGTRDSARVVYSWEIAPTAFPPSEKSAGQPAEPDVAVSAFASWRGVSGRMAAAFLVPGGPGYNDLLHKVADLRAAAPGKTLSEVIYAFVSQKIRTVDLPLGATGFRLRRPMETLSSGYGTPEDKILLATALLKTQVVQRYSLLMVGSSDLPGSTVPTPSAFSRMLLQLSEKGHSYFLDPNLEVAPFGMIAPDLRSRKALTLFETPSPDLSKYWAQIPDTLPFSSTQRVNVDATITPDGTLDAKVKYSMRGDNELLLRIAFHQSPRDKWKEVAQLISLSDGFRGKILSASASDPYATDQAFSVEYEISQPKFVDWSKKPVRIPAPLPLLSVPDLPGKVGETGKSGPIDLGTPLDVDTRVTLHLPLGTSIEIPTGTVVDRDYATFASRYNIQSGTVTATRHINFLHRHVDADRTPDYAAFLHAVQTDQSQLLTLTRATASPQPTAAKSQPPKP